MYASLPGIPAGGQEEKGDGVHRTMGAATIGGQSRIIDSVVQLESLVRRDPCLVQKQTIVHETRHLIFRAVSLLRLETCLSKLS